MIDLLRELLTPEAHADPYVWAAVALAHFAVGIMIQILTGRLWLSLLVYGAFEILQGAVGGFLFWDSLLDWCCVALGSATGCCLQGDQFKKGWVSPTLSSTKPSYASKSRVNQAIGFSSRTHHLHWPSRCCQTCLGLTARADSCRVHHLFLVSVCSLCFCSVRCPCEGPP